MPEFIGPIAIPEVSATGVFPFPVDYGMARVDGPKVVAHAFASGDAKAEQRFYLGDGARRFSVRLGSLTKPRRQALIDFFEARRGSYEPFTLNLIERDGSAAAYTVRFAAPELTVEQLSECIYSAGLDLVEEPATTPSCSINATESRFPSPRPPCAISKLRRSSAPATRLSFSSWA